MFLKKLFSNNKFYTVKKTEYLLTFRTLVLRRSKGGVLLKPLVPLIASYVKDSNDMLCKLKEIERLPDDAFLVTIDVGLYPHIPHGEGLQAIRKALDKRTEEGIPTEDIVELASIVLKNNNFVFEEKLLQKLGTAIGTKMAPSYANLFMEDNNNKNNFKIYIALFPKSIKSALQYNN